MSVATRPDVTPGGSGTPAPTGRARWLVLAYLRLPPLPDVLWWRLPAPTVLTLGGVAAGLLVAALSRIGVVVGARRRAARARTALLQAIGAVTERLVVEPLRAERTRYDDARAALEQARSGR